MRWILRALSGWALCDRLRRLLLVELEKIRVGTLGQGLIVEVFEVRIKVLKLRKLR